MVTAIMINTNNLFLRLTLCALVLLLGRAAGAEPWLSNRYAQNCASCHAPGRVNLPAMSRRCTLSCQGCHVNPSGGGIRNFYGRWNQSRWLNSLQWSAWRLQANRPAQLNQQEYDVAKIRNYVELKSANRPENSETNAEKGPPLKTVSGFPDEELYDRRRAADEHATAKQYRDFLARVPGDDPLRQTASMPIEAGGDIRYFYLQKNNSLTGKKTYTFPMAADIGVRVSPLRHLSLVTEARFANPPTRSEFDQLYTAGPRVRSAYLLADDLAFNTYLMSGLYRPMFGHYNVDHNSLASVLTGLGYDAVFRTTSLGTAPNVPFLNVHWVQPMHNTSFRQDSGYVVNLGGRWVTLGASLILSYWDTEEKKSTNGIRRKMQSIAVGGKLGRWIPNLDVMQIIKETSSSRDEGTLLSFENRVQLWREIYGVFNYSEAGTAKDLSDGRSRDIGAGLRAFLLSGLDFEIQQIHRFERKPASQSREDLFQGQVHFYF